MSTSPSQRFEYEFVRLGEGRLSLGRQVLDDYQGVIQEHAEAGWRLVQIFAPSIGLQGAPVFFELVFERPI